MVEEDVPETPTTSRGADLDVIRYVPELDAYFSPGRLLPISVRISKNLCSQCGVLRPRNWCSHLRNAALKAGMQVKNTPIFMRSLTQLRKNQRADKTKSGRKAPRKFDLIQIHELNTEEQSEEIQLTLDSSLPLLPKSTVDDAINAVVAQAEPEENATIDPIDVNVGVGQVDEKLWCVCNKPADGDMIGCDNVKQSGSILNVSRLEKFPKAIGSARIVDLEIQQRGK